MKGNPQFKKVVLIDDDLDTIDRFNSIVKHKNLSDYFVSFDNAIDGINFLNSSNTKELPSYILLDLYMPQMSGFDFLKYIDKKKQLKDRIEIFVCTSSKRKDDMNKAMNYQFVSAYLEKPIPADFLELLIKDYLG
jgi:CheY-like chemotaxis protein